MKIEKGINAVMFLGLLAMVALTIAILLFPTNGMALTGLDICKSLPSVTASIDSSVSSCNGPGSPYACCTGPGTGNCYLDPSTPDLYVVLKNTLTEPSTNKFLSGITGFPNSLFGNISKASSSSGGGLGIKLHVRTDPYASLFINSSTPSLDRQLIGTSAVYPPGFIQKVVRADEDSTTDGGTGISNMTCSKGCPSTPSLQLGTTTKTGLTANNDIKSTLYTLVLYNYVKKISSCSTTGVYDFATGFGTGANALCTKAGSPYACCKGSGSGTCAAAAACTGPSTPYACCTSAGQGCGLLQDFINYFQIQNIDHEIGHQLCLAADNNTLNHHYTTSWAYTAYAAADKTGAGSMMESSAFSKCSGGVTTFYIPAIFDASDPIKIAIAGTTCPLK